LCYFMKVHDELVALINEVKGFFNMDVSVYPRKLILEEFTQKVNKLSSELAVSKVIDRCTPLERKKISVMINEIKYNAHRIKNML
jgi:hypothetical protein